MIIQSIKLKNFLCYYGDNNEIHFKNGLNLILGENGYGKSKLYDAFQWVINDHISPQGPNTKEKTTRELKKALISERAIDEAQIGDSIEVSVRLEVTEVSSSGEVYLIERKYFIQKQSNITFVEAKDSHLTVSKQTVKIYHPLSDADSNSTFGRIFPSDILPYMWFQGERGVENLVDTDKPEKLLRIINRLSDISRWDEYINISQLAYKEVKNENNAKSKNNDRIGKEATELVNRETLLTNYILEKESDLAHAKERNASAEDRSNSVIGRQQSAAAIKQFRSELHSYETRLSAIEQELENLELSKPKMEFSEFWILEGTDKVYKKFEAKYGRYFGVVSQRKAILELSKEEKDREQSRLPKGVPERVHIQSMLEKEHCLVCNREAKVGSNEYDAIKSLLPELQDADKKLVSIEPELRSLMNRSMIYLDRAKGSKKGRESILRKQKTLVDEKISLLDSIENLNESIARETANGEDVDNIVSIFNNAIKEIKMSSGQIASYESQISSYKKELSQINRRLKELSANIIEPWLKEKEELLEVLVRVTQRKRDQQYNKLIQSLEDSANLHYSRMNQGVGAVYGKIKFVNNIEGGLTPIISDDNGVKMENFNTSQITSMKLAIIMAIITANTNRDDANRYPLISDAPISDFGFVKAKAFLKETAGTFNQSIIILKDFLTEDLDRPARFVPNVEELKLIKADVESQGKTLQVFQLDLPDGQNTEHRRTLSVNIKSISI